MPKLRLTTQGIMSVLAGLLLVASQASAQSYNHQTCFKAKDAQKFDATAALDAIDSTFTPPADCTIKGKAKYYCLPTDAPLTSFSVDGAPGTELPVAGFEPVPDRVCYKVKCPKVDLPPELVSDRFGSRNLSKFKAKLICTPAIQGVAGVCGDGILDGGEVCDDGNTSGGDCCNATCTVSASDGLVCDDGDSCTTGDVCSSGSCVGTDLSDVYEPNDTQGTSNFQGNTGDDDSFPHVNLNARLYPGTDAADWFDYTISDEIFGNFDPRADIVVPAGDDLELFFGYVCDQGTVALTCPGGTTSCTADGIPGCCRSGTGTIQFASIDCVGFPDDGRAYARVMRLSGAPMCDSYLLSLGDD